MKSFYYCAENFSHIIPSSQQKHRYFSLFLEEFIHSRCQPRIQQRWPFILKLEYSNLSSGILEATHTGSDAAAIVFSGRAKASWKIALVSCRLSA